LFAVPLVLIGLYALAQAVRAPEVTGLLWQDPLGLKMLLGSVVRLAVGAVGFLGGCAILNHVARVRWGTGATVAQVGLTVVWLALFCAPLALVVAVGPAAIQIQQNLNAP
jgi:hypothetical protein